MGNAGALLVSHGRGGAHRPLIRVSVDLVTDAKTGIPYYLADIAVDRQELARAADPALSRHAGLRDDRDGGARGAGLHPGTADNVFAQQQWTILI